MCVVTEELSAPISASARSARVEIAAELILAGSTDEQKRQLSAEDRVWRNPADGGLHRTEHGFRPRQPAHARAVKEGDVYKSRQQDLDHHPVRADPSDALVAPIRTSQATGACRCCSLKNARRRFEQPSLQGHDRRRDRGSRLSRHEEEFEIGFDGFEVKAANLLGGEEGQASSS